MEAYSANEHNMSKVAMDSPALYKHPIETLILSNVSKTTLENDHIPFTDRIRERFQINFHLCVGLALTNPML